MPFRKPQEPKKFMKFWSRNNLEELDLLTAQDFYSISTTYLITFGVYLKIDIANLAHHPKNNWTCPARFYHVNELPNNLWPTISRQCRPVLKYCKATLRIAYYLAVSNRNCNLETYWTRTLFCLKRRKKQGKGKKIEIKSLKNVLFTNWRLARWIDIQSVQLLQNQQSFSSMQSVVKTIPSH